MYTVLILSRKAIDSYHEYEPIMAVGEKSDSIGVCTWYESANTIDTAVPELSGLIRRRKQWRAIVVQTELPEKEDKYAVLNNNPFDYAEEDISSKEYPFLIKEQVDGKEAEKIIPSKYPMVLISQLLGGIPVQSPDFKSQFIAESHTNLVTGKEEDEAQEKKPDKITERLTITQKQKSEDLHHYRKLCEEWNQRFASVGSKPSEIILIRRRKVSFVSLENHVQTDWKDLSETQSSIFWNRMGYPNLCRFLTFDVDVRGQLTEQGDMFRFWNAVLLLACNRINSDVLQPYRLYRLDVQLNRDKLRESVQSAVNWLNYAQYRMEQVSIQQQSRKTEEKDNELPDLELPVKLDLASAVNKAHIPMPMCYSALTEGKKDDLATWEAYTAETAKAWNDKQTAIRRLLGKTAEKMRKTSEVDESQVDPLTEYQKEDLMEQLDEYYVKILEEQETLPVLKKKAITEKVMAVDQEVRKHIDRRLGANRIIVLLVVILLSIVVAMGCAFYRSQSPWYIPAAYIFGTILICLCGMGFSLIHKRNKLNKETKKFYVCYAQAQEKLLEGGKRLAAFLSHVGTSMLGNSYLFALDNLEKKQQEAVDETDRRTKALFRFEEVLSKWCDALQLNVNFDDHNAMNEMIENRHAIDFELLSSLEVSRDCRVKINRTGITVKGIYDYVDYLLIEREGIYDE